MNARSVLMNCALAVIASLAGARGANAAQVGIKYNRPKIEFPAAVLKDFQRFHADRIDAVMICLPWSQWEPEEGKIDQSFISMKLAPVLEFCAKNGMTIVISNHCSFWGTKGDWSVPKWLKEKPGFESSGSCLTASTIRKYHVSFLNRLIDATRGFPAVVGYNLLNEPVAASEYSVKKNNAAFQERWDGVLEICREVRRHADELGMKKYLTIGNAGGEAAYAEYAWKTTGKTDLTALWTKTLDKIAAQGATALIESARFYPNRMRIRTEGFLSYATLGATRDTEDFTQTKAKWTATGDHAPVLYDYDAVYNYEGEVNAAVPNLEAFYAWRIGTPNGSSKSLTFFDHRHGDRPTPYYWALRDLASGVDSFEAYDPAIVPKTGPASAAFDPTSAKPAVSKRWSGDGAITATRESLPRGTGSTIAARVALKPGQSVTRTVIAAHWRDNGVTDGDSFVFYAKAQSAAAPTLVVSGERTLRAQVAIAPGDWMQCRVSLRDLGLKTSDVPAIRAVTFANQTDSDLVFLADELLIRGVPATVARRRKQR